MAVQSPCAGGSGAGAVCRPAAQRGRQWGRLTAGLVGLLLVARVAAAGTAAPLPRLDGAFLQLDAQHDIWTQPRWRQELAALADQGLGTLVVQWARERGRPYPTDILTTLISLADELGLELYLGLYHDPAFWQRIAAPAPEVKAYLYRVRADDLEVARELLPLLVRSTSFRGFYIPQEIDDLHWQRRDQREQLAWFLQTLLGELRRLAPGAQVLVSTFARGHASPRGFAAAWAELLAAASFDAVLFQTGYGDGALTAAGLSRYLEELDARRGATQLWAVVEAFRVLEQGEGVFRADSAPFARVREQLQVAQHANRRLVFSLRYLSSSGEVPGAAALAGEYRRYRGPAR